jgi:antitoxin (DNA-binding transcriptional repressor) of toxin-antitoxin stability system
MAMLRTVGVRDLKNGLSAWLREVKTGTRVLVTEHGTVIAELRSPPAADLEPAPSSGLEEWVRAGRLVAPRRPREPMPDSPVGVPAGTARQLLDAEREEL